MNDTPPLPQDEQSKLQGLNITLNPDEELVQFIEKHWGTILWPLTSLGLLILVSLVGLFFTTFVGGFSQTTSILGIILVALYIIIGLYALSVWYSYQHSGLAITNQRVIDCQQVNAFSRQVQIIDIHEIQSASGHMNPGWGTVLGYGDVWINTMGDKSVTVHDVKSPEVTADLLMQQHHAVAHGGKSEAHTEATPKAPPPPASPEKPAEQPPCTILVFRVNSETLTDLLCDVTLLQVPIITPIENDTLREVEIVVAAEEAKAITAQLKERGVEEIIRSDVTITPQPELSS